MKPYNQIICQLGTTLWGKLDKKYDNDNNIMGFLPTSAFNHMTDSWISEIQIIKQQLQEESF